MSATITGDRLIEVGVILHHDVNGDHTGRAHVRGVFSERGVEQVAPIRDSAEAAAADIDTINEHGLSWWLCSYSSRSARVIAATGEHASDIAYQRRGQHPFEVLRLSTISEGQS